MMDRNQSPSTPIGVSSVDQVNNNNATTSTTVQQQQQQETQQHYGPKPANIRDYIIEAVAIAHQAVQEDTDSEPDLERARRLYRECAHRLEHIRPFVPDEHAKVLNKFSIVLKVLVKSKIYRERAHSIKESSVDAKDVMSISTPSSSTILDEPKDVTSTSATTIFPPPDNATLGRTAGRKHANSINSSLGTSRSDPSSTQSTIPNSFTIPTFTVQFEEEGLPPVPDMNPPEWIHRPFWLMKTLTQTMTTGGYLTPGLYVPTAVWFQQGAKLFAQPAKITFCTNLSTFLQDLAVVDLGNTKLLLESLDSFIEKAEKEKSVLTKQLPHTHSVTLNADKKQTELYSNTTSTSTGKYLSGKVFGFGKSMFKSAMGLVANKAKEETTEHPYIPWLISIFQQSQYLDQWITHFEKTGGPKAVIDRLEKISFYFYFVLCQFVLQDLNVLLERYMRKSRESFSRLFPKNDKPHL